MHFLSTSLSSFPSLPEEARLAFQILQSPISLQLDKSCIHVLDSIVERRPSMISDAEHRLLAACSAAVLIAEQGDVAQSDRVSLQTFERLLEVAR